MEDGKVSKRAWPKVFERALRRFDDAYQAVYDERQLCLADRRFCLIAGAQWEGDVGDLFANKPRFEVNKILLSTYRIINEYRNNRITVDFLPKDGKQDDELADACDGLYRADEQDSAAQEAYDVAFEEAVMGGFGAFRLRAEYEDDEDDEDERQRVRFQSIPDADMRVFFDPNDKSRTKHCAQYVFVLTPMSKEAFEEEYGDDPGGWPKPTSSGFEWATQDMVWVAEYYEIEEKTEDVHVFTSRLSGEEMRVPQKELEDDPQKRAELEATGFDLTRTKRQKVKKVHKWCLSGGGVLEDEGYLPGKCLPVIPVWGKHSVVEGIERYQGHVRPAKDAQRLKNMQLSKLAELSAQSSIEKPIMYPEEIAGHEMMWAEDQVKNWPYLLKNQRYAGDGVTPISAPQEYTRAPNLPPAMAAILQLSEQDMQEILGRQQEGEQMESNLSGKAVELIQQRIDMQSFIYMDGMKQSLRRAGQVWLPMAADLYVEQGRKMKTVGLGGETSTIELLRPVVDNETGEVVNEYDLSKAKFDVIADAGPSSASRRSAVVRSLTNLLQIVSTVDPQTAGLLISAILMQLEGEGLEDIRAHFRKQLVRQGVVKPTEQEQKELAAEAANAQPDPQAELAKSLAAQANADVVKTLADADLKQAQTAKIEAEIPGVHQQRLINGQQAAREAIAPPTPPKS